MEIYLIRHTKPEIEKGICYGQTDIPLASSFEDEIEEILKKYSFPGDEFIVYSSPLLRCKLAAEKLFNSTIHYDKRLMELNFGDWELQKWDDINKTDLNRWMGDFVNVSCPNGESYVNLYDRVLQFIQSLKNSDSTKKIAVVTHAGVIRAFLAVHNNTNLKDSFIYNVEYGEVMIVKDFK
ncbi:MAG: alpha-ribazole phosphatase [Flavobacteriia bacterium]|nr:alpha-ribazole phosphatase [Flavobacteriia bacterium]